VLRCAFSCAAFARTVCFASAQSCGVSAPSSANVLGDARWCPPSIAMFCPVL